ncbi:MAG: DUF3330 domain-containing protein [Candidatus Aminicenantes bacterium]|nr:DUF3330 domain-containing protein [Candidatus Aminicenantes bacterium]
MSDDDKKIACHVCKKIVPKAAAVHTEGAGYVLHFCDTSCLTFWEENKKEDNKEKPKKGKD